MGRQITTQELLGSVGDGLRTLRKLEYFIMNNESLVTTLLLDEETSDLAQARDFYQLLMVFTRYSATLQTKNIKELRVLARQAGLTNIYTKLKHELIQELEEHNEKAVKQEVQCGDSDSHAAVL